MAWSPQERTHGSFARVKIRAVELAVPPPSWDHLIFPEKEKR